MLWLLFITILLVTPVARSEDLDASTLDAIAKSQQVLTDPALRRKAAAQFKGGTRATENVRAIAGNPQNEEEIYALAAEIFGTLAKNAKGEPDKMMEILQKGLSDPAAFGNSLSPAQKQKLHEISIRVPAPAQQSIP